MITVMVEDGRTIVKISKLPYERDKRDGTIRGTLRICWSIADRAPKTWYIDNHTMLLKDTETWELYLLQFQTTIIYFVLYTRFTEWHTCTISLNKNHRSLSISDPRSFLFEVVSRNCHFPTKTLTHIHNQQIAVFMSKTPGNIPNNNSTMFESSVRLKWFM